MRFSIDVEDSGRPITLNYSIVIKAFIIEPWLYYFLWIPYELPS